MIGRLEPKHWLLIGGFLTSMAAMIGGLDHWADLTRPAFVAGLLGQVGVFIGAVFAGAPPNPDTNPLVNPGRRITDPVLPNVGSVTEATRRTLQ